jgi:ribosomal protein L2
MLIHKTIVEQHRDKKGDVLFRSIGVQIKSKIQITRFTKETFDIESFNIHLTFEL